jgi:transposase
VEVVGGVFAPDGKPEPLSRPERRIPRAPRILLKGEKDGWLPVVRSGLQSVVQTQPWRPAIQLDVKKILNRIQRFAGFIYRDIRFADDRPDAPIEVHIEPHASIPAKCSTCRTPCPGYDRLPERRWRFPPLWGIVVWFLYAPRRVECAEHGVVVEHIPWSHGKSPVTTTMMSFLATWARRLSWRETARLFQTSWEAVYRSVEWFVEWGLEHRELVGVHSIGIDEIHWGKGQRAANFLTVIYQIDAGCRRLLWVGPRRTKATLRRGLKALGSEVVAGLRFVCSDMWKPYLTVVSEMAGQALHVVDRFHVVMNLNKAVDQVRREESGRLRGQPLAKRLKKMRWKLLRRGSRVRGRARAKLESLLACRLATARAWNLKEAFHQFWRYRSVWYAGGFLDYWCERAMRSRLEPMKRIARMLRSHEKLLLNWFRARGEISSGAVEGLNNKIRVVTRRSYGFRTYRGMELALYHNLGRLPEPPVTHRFC